MKQLLMSSLNLDYETPLRDIRRVCGYHTDGSVNVQFSLKALRNMLQENINKLDKLIEHQDQIRDIYWLEDKIGISFNSDSIKEQMIHQNVLINEEDIEEPVFSDDEETNQQRYRMINNIVNQTQIPDILSSDSDSDESDTDDIIDQKQMLTLINRHVSTIIYSDSE